MLYVAIPSKVYSVLQYLNLIRVGMYQIGLLIGIVILGNKIGLILMIYFIIFYENVSCAMVLRDTPTYNCPYVSL